MLATNRRPRAGSAVIAVAMTGVAIVVLAAVVDRQSMAAGVERALHDPFGLVLVGIGFVAAFGMRAVAWRRVLPALAVRDALAALHLAVAANHVLPLRMGEPVRVVWAVRRGVRPADAIASTIMLRSADVVSLAALGALAGPGIVLSIGGPWLLAAVAGVAVFGVSAAAVALRRTGTARTLRFPDAVACALVVAAWLAEAVVVREAASWFGADLTFTAAVVVLAAAVSAQLAAIAPGGFGTYEAAATAAMVAVGVEPNAAVVAAVGVHATKTVLSLLAGCSAVPDVWLHRRRRRRSSVPVTTPPTAGTGPIVLFLPARNEAPRLAAVLERVPATVAGHTVEVVVVDDGSTDDTTLVARAHGADVVAHPVHLGLGAAVRTGLAAALERSAVAVAFCDADGEYDPAELPVLVDPILRGGAHYVVGNRFTPERGTMLPHRWFGNRVLTIALRLVTDAPVTDGQSGFRALSTDASRDAVIAHDYNYAQVLTIDLLRKGYGYHEVPISYSFRRSGRSFVRLVPYLRQVVPTVWRLYQQEKSTCDPHTTSSTVPSVVPLSPSR